MSVFSRDFSYLPLVLWASVTAPGGMSVKYLSLYFPPWLLFFCLTQTRLRPITLRNLWQRESLGYYPACFLPNEMFVCSDDSLSSLIVSRCVMRAVVASVYLSACVYV